MKDKSPNYKGNFPFHDPKYLNRRISTELDMNDFKLTVYRLFTFLNKIGLCSSKHLL